MTEPPSKSPTIDPRCLEELCCKSMEHARVPGLALAVVHRGNVVYARGFGVTSVECGTSVTVDTLFRTGSTTKPLIGTMIMRLVDSGLLELDRPAKRYVPWLTLSWPAAEDEITLRMLLSHTSGLPTEFAPHGSQDPAALESSLREELPRYRFVAPPGKFWSYSNVGIRLAAHIVEIVTGELLPRLMERLVFEPLEMRRTTFDPLMAMTYPLALPHEVDDDGRLRVARPLTNNAARLAAGGAFSSALDMANFAKLHLMRGRFGGQQLVSSESIAQMHRPQANKYTLHEDFYGLTLESDLANGIQRIGHPGNFPPYGCRLTMVVDEGIAVILLVSRATEFSKSATAIVDSILLQLLQRQIEPSPPSAHISESGLWQRITGRYFDHIGNSAQLSVIDGNLHATLDDGSCSLDCYRSNLYCGKPKNSDRLIVFGFPESCQEQLEYIIVNNRPFRREASETL